AFMLDDAADTYWENANEGGYQTIDLGDVKDVGRIDLYWRGDDGGKGKYYDLQASDDGVNYTTVFRQTHGATAKQSVYYYGRARYLRVVDYQSPNSERYMLEGIEVFSQYPDGYEQRVTYDTSVQFPQQQVLTAANGNGSYVTGDITFPSARLIAYLDESLRDKPVPTNDWWQGLLMRDKGYNMYLNPLVATYTDNGLWLTNPGDGYYSGDNPGNGRQTINVDVHDICIGYRGMKSSAEVRVTGYTDYGISAVMTDNPAVDKMTTFLSQGSLYAYCLFAEPEKATVSSDNLVAAYDINGAPVLGEIGASYTGDCIVVCVRTHSGYENDVEKGNAKQYEERFYVVNAPNETQFVREENHIAVVMQNGNYMSVGALSGVVTVSAAQANERGAHGAFDVDEAILLHTHGYAFVIGTSCTFEVDDATNDVTTTYTAQTYAVRNGFSAEAVTAFMPHHYKKSSDACSAKYVYKSVRGDIRAYTGNVYTTTDKFYGVVPTFTEPNDNGYSAQVLYEQLVMLYKNNGGDNPPDKSLVSGDPYWQGKNLHPMAIAALAADQIGATDIRDAFLAKIRFILEDWFTYTPGEETDGKSAYFYYDGEWGTLYYRNSEFGAGVNLADHHFTYGYYM
ncbi:MAG: discoidin domain-containing protein, partial [Clostridiales bacterium]|nr:discoidin domain-containing protein [Clostridiales bacterium]